MRIRAAFGSVVGVGPRGYYGLALDKCEKKNSFGKVFVVRHLFCRNASHVSPPCVTLEPPTPMPPVLLLTYAVCAW